MLRSIYSSFPSESAGGENGSTKSGCAQSPSAGFDSPESCVLLLLPRRVNAYAAYSPVTPAPPVPQHSHNLYPTLWAVALRSSAPAARLPSWRACLPSISYHASWHPPQRPPTAYRGRRSAGCVWFPACSGRSDRVPQRRLLRPIPESGHGAWHLSGAEAPPTGNPYGANRRWQSWLCGRSFADNHLSLLALVGQQRFNLLPERIGNLI